MDGSREVAGMVFSPRLVRWVTAFAVLAVAGALLAALCSGQPFQILLIHSLTLLLIALVTYGFVVLPLSAAISLSALGLLSTLGAWARTGSALLGGDALALGALMGIAGVQQHRRAFRLHRLKQQLNDLDEELYLKEQALRINQQTDDALQRKLGRYQQLQTVAETLTRLTDLEAICQLAVDRAFELIGKSDACLLFLVDREHQELALHASKKAPTVAVIRTKQGDQFDRYVLRTQRPLLVNDVRRDFRFTVTGDSTRPLGSVIACPLLVSQSAEGVLRLDSAQPATYTQDDLRFLDILLHLIATAMANARLFEQTQQLAITDGLTGLYRRQPFLEQLGREVARAGRSREPFAVLMLDIDDFKRCNDTFGHTVGDAVLRMIADIVRASVPPDGMCARYGGEEFAILLPKASRREGVAIAQRIRRSVEQQTHAASEGPAHPVTVSLGVSVFPDDAPSDLELIRQADQGLYRAKRAGKNRVWPES